MNFYSRQQRIISGNTSLFLDTIRIVAAFVVFWGHACEQWAVKAKTFNGIAVDWGHFSVVVFFVLSGYVIAHTTSGSHRGMLQYAQARLSRLYSIIFPAIFITALVEIYLRFFSPDILINYTRGLSLPRYVLALFFLNEIWFWSASPPLNGPLWSLSYEFWYYVIFGLFFFRAKNLYGLLIIVLACLFVGPKILLMMPIWILGNVAYKLRHPPKLLISQLWILVVIALFVAIVMVLVLPAFPNKLGVPPLYFAGQFVTDFIIGLFVFIALWLLPTSYNNSITQKKTSKSKNVVLVKFIRKVADLTFPIYVLHDPLLILFRSIFGTKLHSESQMWGAIIVVTLLCIIIGSFLENNKSSWSNFFSFILQNVKRAFLKNKMIHF